MSDLAVSLNDLSAEAGEATDEDIFVVETGVYEGPLHLLLELARRQKVDLLQVSILELAEQYLGFIKAAKSKRIDLAADYLLMAAWLAFLKSRLMLPKPESAEEEGETGEEMAAKLAFRLKRLDAMRRAGEELMSGPILGERVFLRGAPEQPRIVKHTEFDTSLWHLTHAFGAIRQRREKDAPHRIEKQFVLPLETARQSLRVLGSRLGEWSSLKSIQTELTHLDPDVPPRSVTASVFSAALELARDGDVELRQDAHFAPLYLRAPGPAPVEASYD
ncbi:MAG: ScpA family protein [Pseudomonadota bacterium]